jgi:hypothetical protein
MPDRPLHVVDRHQHRLLAGEFGEHPDHGGRHGPRICRLTAGDAQQRGGERKLLRMRELRTHLVERWTDDVSQGRIGELRLALGRPARSKRYPRAPARRTDSNQTVDFPIPASPSTSSARGPRGTGSRNADTTAISRSRPITAA